MANKENKRRKMETERGRMCRRTRMKKEIRINEIAVKLRIHLKVKIMDG